MAYPTPSGLIGPVRITPTPAVVTIGPTEIATFKYGIIVNDTEDVLFDVFPEALNRLSEDPAIGINAPISAVVASLHLVEERMRTSQFAAAISYEREQHPTRSYAFLRTSVDLVDIIKGEFGLRNISATDVTMRNPDLNSELNLQLTNALLIATHYGVSQPQPMVLSVEAQGLARSYGVVAINLVGDRFLQRVNNS